MPGTGEETGDQGDEDDRADRAHRLRRRTRPGAVAGLLGGRPDLHPGRRRPPRAPVRAGHVPLPVGRPAHGPRRSVRDGRRGRPLLEVEGLRRPASDRLGLLRSAGGKRGDPTQCAPRRMDVREHRDPGQLIQALRAELRLDAAAAHLGSGVLPLDAMAVPAVLRTRSGLPQGQLRELVPEGSDRAGQRAGRRRNVRAMRFSGHQAAADPVVLQDHRLRRPVAGRHGPAGGRLARTRADHAAQLDRTLGRRVRRLQDRHG